MSTYTTIRGDTFDSISRKQYGVETYAATVASSNPGAAEPLAAGTILVTPDIPGAPRNASAGALSTSLDEVAVFVAGERFRFWSTVAITRSTDNVDTVTISCPFDSSDPAQRAFFRPFSFSLLRVTVGGAAIFTGTLVGVPATVTGDGKTVSMTAYSTPGVLWDCTPPQSAYPLEFEGQTLRDIAARLCDPFGITSVFLEDSGAAFERIDNPPASSIAPFLSRLARQRGLIFNSSTDGELVFYTPADSGPPVATMSQLESPLVSVSTTTTPRAYFSHVTGLAPALIGLPAVAHTIVNPHLRGVVRPHVFTASEVESSDLVAAVEAKAGRMFGNAAAYTLNVATWRDPNGALWSPNTFVTLTAPDAMVYDSTLLMIRSVEFNKTPKTQTARITAVLPGSFSGKIPETVPWG